MSQHIDSTPKQTDVAELNNKIGNVGNTDLQAQVTTLNSNLTYTTKTVVAGGVFLREIGDVCFLCIAGEISAPSGATTTIATLDAGDRPTVTMYGVCAVDGGSSNKYALVSVNSAGAVMIYNYSGQNASYLYGTIPFIRHQ